jgi:hypothetical protein
MRINADFGQKATLVADDAQWICSPESGVDRRMLDRVGDEVARATSVVRYAPGSSFPRHEHAKGEEFLVLEGIFSDETGDFPTGSYVRNPPGSGHAPYSVAGCRILVKLRQFDPSDLRQFSVDTRDAKHWGGQANTLLLHEFDTECVQMQKIRSGEEFAINPQYLGTEIFVVEGLIESSGQQFPNESWLRFPPGSADKLTAIVDTLIWIKTGHLTEL